MLDMNAIFHRNLFNKLNSQTSTFETTHLKQLLVNTFVIYTNFTPVTSTKREPLHIGPYKKTQNLSDVTFELMAKHGSAFHTHRGHISPIPLHHQ